MSEIIEMNDEHKRIHKLRMEELNTQMVQQLNEQFKDFGVEIIKWEPLTKINDYERVLLIFKVKP
jgi:hypothetical protein